ncbi:MAG: hypothetical protein IT385_01345 [Deltaproteobacteria bacterium]|nr:hypothetical protein [Deltaproteobacteria bacterium]
MRERLGMSLAAVQAKMAVGLLARVSGEAGWLAPPDEDTLAEVQRLESSVLAGESDVQMSVARARTGRVSLRLAWATRR